MKLDLDTVKNVAGVAGLLALLAAAVYWLVYAQFNTPMRVLLAVGILLVGIYVAVAPEEVLEKLTSPRTLYGGNVLLTAVAVVGIMGAINFFANRYHQRWDLTANQQYSLSDQTLKVLAELPAPVDAVAFFSPEQFGRQQAEDLLKEYSVRSGGKISYQFVDPVAQPAAAISYAITRDGTIVFQSQGRRQDVTGTRETDFTNALMRLVNPQPKKAYFLTGHGERPLDLADSGGYSQVKLAMESDNFVVEPLALLGTQDVPEDANLVVLAGPRRELANEEEQALGRYLDRGGKLLILADPRSPTKLDGLLGRFGVQVGQLPIVDPASNRFGVDALSPVITSYGFHKITEQSPGATLFPFVTYITLPKEPPAGTTVEPLAQTSDRSWAETDQNTARFDPGTDPQGPFTVAAAIEYDSRDSSDRNMASSAEQPPRPKTRVVIFGTSNLVSNGVIVQPVGNRDLFLNAANWLAESEELIAIRPKPQEDRTMFLSSVERNTILVTSVGLLPLAVLAAGVYVWWRRR